jgi:hypothetical protein
MYFIWVFFIRSEGCFEQMHPSLLHMCDWLCFHDVTAMNEYMGEKLCNIESRD